MHNYSYITFTHTGMDLIEASGVPRAGLTVYQGFQPFVQHCASIQQSDDIGAGVASLKSAEVNTHTAGKRVLIHGGSGGLGTLAIQYCKNVLGMFVITTVSTSEIDFVKNLGADEVIDFSTTKFEDAIQPVDVVFDTKGYSYETRTLMSGVIKEGGWYLKSLENTLEPEQLEQPGTLQFFLPDMQLRPLQILSRVLQQHLQKATEFVQSLRIPFLTLPHKPLVNYHSVVMKPNSVDLQDCLAMMVASGTHTVVDRVFPMTLDKVSD